MFKIIFGSRREIPKHYENFFETQKKKLFFHEKHFFFKKIFISKFFQKSLIGGDFDFLDEFDSVWDPKKASKIIFQSLKMTPK